MSQSSEACSAEHAGTLNVGTAAGLMSDRGHHLAGICGGGSGDVGVGPAVYVISSIFHTLPVAPQQQA